MTDRLVLTDGSGRWFDADAAEDYPDAQYWDGNNNISRATGSQWARELLYRTAGGRWILNSGSDHRDHYTEITSAAAAVWLSINEHAAPPACASEYAALKIT